jgi:RNA-directed DNA polymerase
VVRQVTAKDRYARALSSVSEWCRDNRGLSVAAQHAHLSKMVRGHFAFYAITGNGQRIRWYLHQVERIWKKWLSRRGGGNYLWSRLNAFLDCHPLPKARIIHKYAVASESLP